MLLKCLFFGFVVFVIRGDDSFPDRVTRVWLPNSNINTPSNWLPPSKNDDCHGYIFSEKNEIYLKLGGVFAEEIVLPKSGFFILGDVEFISKNKKCTKLKPFKRSYRKDPKNWAMPHEPFNAAIPDTDRVPCMYDDELYQLDAPDDIDEDWAFQLRVGDLLKYTWSSSDDCEDNTGCVCGNDLSVCSYTDEILDFNCTDPIAPMGFCNKMCGAAILLNPKSGFHINSIKKALEDYHNLVDTYVGKMSNTTNVFIQVVFAEKQYKGDSLDYAREFYEKLSDPKYYVRKIELQLSGPQYIGGSVSTIPVIFGSLMAVLLIYTSIFVFYYTGLSKYSYNISDRLRLRTSGVNNFFGTARYNRQGSNLSFGSQSMGSSVMSLEKSFDNPMFGKVSGEGSSKDYGSISNETSSTHENPLYTTKSTDHAESKDLVDIAEEETEE